MPATKRKRDTDEVQQAKKPRTEGTARNAPPSSSTAPQTVLGTEIESEESREGARQDPQETQSSNPKMTREEKGRRKQTDQPDGGEDASDAKSREVRKLEPPRPFPAVPTSVSATGPRSAHTEGKNYIAVTRKTKLGAYLRRCRDVVIKDGYRTLHLSALGAAIPHLMQLALSLPEILPFAPNEIHTEVLTGTVEVQDEIIPDDEDEDISYRTRGKSSVSVTIRVGDGKDEIVRPPKPKGKSRRARDSNRISGDSVATKKVVTEANEAAEVATERERIVVRDEDMDTHTY